MKLLYQLNEMEKERQKGQEASAIRSALKKFGVKTQRLASKNHASGEYSRGSYSDKRKGGGRAVKIYVQEPLDAETREKVKQHIVASIPGATVTFGPGKRQHSYSDPSAWVRVVVK